MAENENIQAPAASRYSLTVENSFSVDENESIACVGNLHGEIHKGDSIFILHPRYPSGIEATVSALVVDGKTVDKAAHCRTAVVMTEVKDPKQISKYSVITNVKPRFRPEQNKSVENPFLVGLTMEYERFIGEDEFAYTFMAGLLTSMLITPAQLHTQTEEEADRKQQKVSFKLIKHPSDEKKLVLPLFTDVATMRMWNSVVDETGGHVQTLVLPFERSAEVGLANGGLVINPFGPKAIYVSNSNIQNTLTLGKQVRERNKPKADNN